MQRIQHIEGLRACLALWVVAGHLFSASGYTDYHLPGFLKIVRSGWFAVDIFIIISGFVIFYLLDHRKESYKRFISNRFFRLWPLFILLFTLGIPVSLLSLSNLTGFTGLYPESHVGYGNIADRIESWWENIFFHIALHVPMLHGVIPDSILPYAPSAFLPPAWSISLEWQFYLVAPFAFLLVTARSAWGAVAVCLACLLVYLYHARLPEVQFGAFLPKKNHYFFLGCLSYFAFKRLHFHPASFGLLPVGIAVGGFMFLMAGGTLEFLPVSLWLVFFTLLCDLQKATRHPAVSATGWIFTNPVALHLGKISYSIYLSHMLVITITQTFILHYFTLETQKAHFFVLALLAIPLTLAVSHFLFKFVESPGIAFGKRICNSPSHTRRSA